MTPWPTAPAVVLFQVDAFTDRPFAGNPAAVCLLSHWPADSWLQSVAAELNLSDTAFLVKQEHGFDLRWFTPALEIELCGHATLASAHVLWSGGYADPQGAIPFSTRSGTLQASLRDGFIELDFPATPATLATVPDKLLTALGTTPVYVARTRFDYLVEVASEAVVRRLAPDFRLLRGVPARGIIVTSRSDDARFDFVSRFFAPASGIDEDPVTGSSHCCLAPFWSTRLGKNPLVGYQASKRGGVVHVCVAGNRVLLRGHAVIVTRGELVALPENP